MTSTTFLTKVVEMQKPEKAEIKLSYCSIKAIMSLPENTRIDGDLICKNIDQKFLLPDWMRVNGNVEMSLNSELEILPDNMTIAGILDLEECGKLIELPMNLIVCKDIHLMGCEQLKGLPPDIVFFGKIFCNYRTGFYSYDILNLKDKIGVHPF